MAQETAQGTSLENAAQGGTAQEGQVNPFSPAVFTRYQEPDGSNGSIYDIELLAHVQGSSAAGDYYRLAACTLVIGAPFGKNKGQRVVDGRIENLWLKDQETAKRLDNIQLLATLLGYVQEFCATTQGVPHLSSIQKADHPAWLKDFFTLAGFRRCECLKPEAGGQYHRVCIEQQSTGESIVQAPIEPVTAIAEARSEDKPTVTNGNERAVERPQGKETVSAKVQLNGTTVPKATETTAKKPLSDDQALKWLTQNKEILSQLTASGATTLSTPLKAKPQEPKPAKETSVSGRPSIGGTEQEASAKRKRDSTTDAQNSEVSVRSTRTRKDHDARELPPQAKHSVQEEGRQPKPPSKSSQLPPAKHSSSRTDTTRSSEASMTDALLAQCDGSGATKSPKQIKRETPATAVRPTNPPPLPEAQSYRPLTQPNLPAKDLTCYYWSTQGACTHSDETCRYAHYDTGSVARPPGSYRFSKPKSFRFGQYDGGDDHWSDVNGINIKGSYNGADGLSGSTSAPTGPKAELDGYSVQRSYDSWRPS